MFKKKEIIPNWKLLKKNKEGFSYINDYILKDTDNIFCGWKKVIIINVFKNLWFKKVFIELINIVTTNAYIIYFLSNY